jgi:hypothetical protein
LTRDRHRSGVIAAGRLWGDIGIGRRIEAVEAKLNCLVNRGIESQISLLGVRCRFYGCLSGIVVSTPSAGRTERE